MKKNDTIMLQFNQDRWYWNVSGEFGQHLGVAETRDAAFTDACAALDAAKRLMEAAA